ncbi:MAG TPA: YtxH domain-containing protein [Thermomicrobiales bacterium]|nr:YtxH domain-containing protein [Thermomicrobiales bacterium]
MGTERHNVAFVVGAVVGGLTAATITLFQAPQSGAQTRADIQERLKRMTTKTSGAAQTVAGRTRSSVAKSRELAASAAGKVRSEDHSAHQETDEILVVGKQTTSGLEPPLVAGETSRPLTEAERQALDLDPTIDEHAVGTERREVTSAAEAAALFQPDRSTRTD